MLAKLSDAYQTDLSDLLYGRSGKQKKLRTIRIAATAMFSGLLLLILIHSCLIFLTNRWLPVPASGVTDATWPVIEMRFAIHDAREQIQKVSQTASTACCLILAVLITNVRRLPLFRKGIFLVLAFVVGSLACTVPFGAFDPVYHNVDYLLVLGGIFPAVCLLTVYGGILWLIQKRRSNRKKS